MQNTLGLDRTAKSNKAGLSADGGNGRAFPML